MLCFYHLCIHSTNFTNGCFILIVCSGVFPRFTSSCVHQPLCCFLAFATCISSVLDYFHLWAQTVLVPLCLHWIVVCYYGVSVRAVGFSCLLFPFVPFLSLFKSPCLCFKGIFPVCVHKYYPAVKRSNSSQ